MEKVCGSDKNFEITLLPHFFAQALKDPVSLTSQQYTMLGLANVCAWIAYTIYDDFLDCKGKPTHLPIANTALRASLSCFRALSAQDTIQRYVAGIFKAMDEANSWEVNYCRFAVQAERVTITDLPYYRTGAMLAARSFAHALAPMVILAQTSHGSPRARYIESGFRHYLIAWQLDDDMRDWQEDMQAGQASYVVTAILRDMRMKPGEYSLHALLSTMQKYFRLTTMPKVSWRILRHIDMSRRAFAKSQLLRPSNDIYALLDGIEQSVDHSLDKRAKMQALMRTPANQLRVSS